MFRLISTPIIANVSKPTALVFSPKGDSHVVEVVSRRKYQYWRLPSLRSNISNFTAHLITEGFKREVTKFVMWFYGLLLMQSIK